MISMSYGRFPFDGWQRLQLFSNRRCPAVEEPDHRQPRLLRARRERPSRRAAEKGDEIASFHSITSSATASSDGGTSTPSGLSPLR
jgi:hypothetical protein